MTEIIPTSSPLRFTDIASLAKLRVAIFVHVFSKGILERLGHDLRLGFPEADLTCRRQGSQVQVSCSLLAHLLHFQQVLRGAALSEKDIREVETISKREILAAARYPSIEIISSFDESISFPCTVSAKVNLRGICRKVALQISAPDYQLQQVAIRADLVQSDFGITPFKALLGSLKVCDRLEIHALVQQAPNQ